MPTANRFDVAGEPLDRASTAVELGSGRSSVRIACNGLKPASQASDDGSILFTRSSFVNGLENTGAVKPSSFRDGPLGPGPEPMNIGRAIDFRSWCSWIPGSRPEATPRNDSVPPASPRLNRLASGRLALALLHVRCRGALSGG
jgi:hypothetical protein